MHFSVIPVIDLKAGQVVRGVGGHREDYRPIKSILTPSAAPVKVAAAFRDRLGLTQLYLADLDAIAGAAPALSTSAAIKALGISLWVDAGIRDLESARRLAEASIEQVIVGLETLPGPETLAEIVRSVGSDRITFSLDLKRGEPMGDRARWRRANAFGIAVEAISLGIRRILLLDLAHVGLGAGTGTEELCQRLVLQCRDLAILVGGGVRHLQDLQKFKQLGARAALVASALHDGRITVQDLQSVEREED